MHLFSYSEMLTKVQNDNDLTQETFISSAELIGYLNEAIRKSETAIHNFGLEDTYFRANDTLTLVNGTDKYNYPTDIYANKLLKIYYVNGTKKYEVKKIRNLQDTLWFYSGDDYRFLPINNQQASGGNQMQFYPSVTESGAFIQRWYIRDMFTITSDTADMNNNCEVPEAINFIFQHLRWNVAKKSRRADLIAQEASDLKVEYDLMMETLREMIPDENNKVMLDLSAYYNQEVDLYY